MDGPATINSLPAEMHILIAEFVDNADFHNLRLASRDFAANSVDVFAERFFTRRRHLYTMQSLVALRNISYKPVFARHIKRIELVVIGVEEDPEFQWGVEIHRPVPTKYREEYYPDEEMDKAYQWYQRQRDDLLHYHERLLTEIFHNLKKLGVGRNVKITTDLWHHVLEERDAELGLGFSHEDTWKAHGGVHGVRKLLKKLWPWASRADLRSGNIDLATDALLTALATTGQPLDTLDLAYNSPLRLSKLKQTWKDDYELPDRLAKVFSNLKELAIGFDSPLITIAMRELIQAATQVYVVYLDFDDLERFPQVTWPNLGRLFLSTHALEARRAAQLVSVCMDRDLHLDGVALPNFDFVYTTEPTM
ncbi:hypothetical protein PRZ48_007693 [Zasmidium cellare]|uniref:F-box domain-containing protein n=1 Tax=Zasmidium cellare TaxID=395010 RepID=A0ABR0EKG0_ZASCE|nr:hypothetical protein PRZ48_007693 [Zasmidium cellare]